MAYSTYPAGMSNVKSPGVSNVQAGYDSSRAAFNSNPLFVLNNGQVFPNVGTGAAYNHQQSSGTENAGAMGYLPSGVFPNFINGTNVVAGGVPAYAWPYSVGSDNPGLVDARRGSWSSADDHLPPTPMTGQVEYWNGLDKSSFLGLPYFGQSPPALTQAYMPGNPYQHMKCADNTSYELINLDGLTNQVPAIPRAVPAMWSNQADLTLAKCLQNPEGITNVYIRGFLPDTTDDDLRGYAARFGEIESHKAIIDMETGKCKGFVHSMSFSASRSLTYSRFGFVKYYSPAAAENCIRGFFHLGYQASYAQVCTKTEISAACLTDSLTEVSQFSLEGS